MRLTLLNPIPVGPRSIDALEVSMPPPSVDLTRPPRGGDRLRWHLGQITALPTETAALLSIEDAERVLDLYDLVVAEARAAVRAINGAIHQ